MTLRNTQKLIQIRTVIFAIANFGLLFPILYYTFYDFGDREFKSFGELFFNVGGVIL